MKPETKTLIQTLHYRFTSETRIDLSLTIHRMDTWYRWLCWGWKNKHVKWSEADLLKVFSYIRSRYERTMWPQCMKFSRLIEKPDVFEEELAMARAHTAPTNRQRVLAMTGRTEPEKEAKPISDFFDPKTKDYIQKLREAIQ